MSRKTRRLLLNRTWEAQESCWKNLATASTTASFQSVQKRIKEELTKYNGKIVGNYDYIEFDNHNHMAQFILAWS
jgi:hypothetical protein